MTLDRILHVFTSTETWTNLTAFAVGWALAEVKAWVAGRLTLRRWRRDSDGLRQRFMAGEFSGIHEAMRGDHNGDLTASEAYALRGHAADEDDA